MRVSDVQVVAVSLIADYCGLGWFFVACSAGSGSIADGACRAPACSAAHIRAQLAIRRPEKDHQRMMDLLGIKELRRGADWNAKSPHAANYDESKANVYPNLPDPLVLKNGKRVTTAKSGGPAPAGDCGGL